MKLEERLKKLDTFYDPVYRMSLGSNFKSFNIFDEKKQELAELILKVIETPEFCRLKGIKQEGILDVSYQSANQNLYQRAIGSVMLGFNAINNIIVNDGSKKLSLSEDLVNKSNLTDEFILALLLKNVGMPPFYDILKQNGLLEGYDLYKGAVDIIQGNGDIHKQFSDRGYETISEVLKTSNNLLDLNILSQFILGTSSESQIEAQEYINILTQLIEGITLFDRHKNLCYNIGSGCIDYNTRAFFSEIQIDEKNLIRLNKNGKKIANHLRLNNDVIRSKIFDEPNVVCNNSMFGHVILEYFNKSDEEQKNEFMLLTDRQAINILNDSGKSTANLLERIFYGKPYMFVKSGIIKDDVDIDAVIAENIENTNYDFDDVLVSKSPKGICTDENWLNFEDMDGKLVDDEAYSEFNTFLKKKYNERENTVYIFVPEIREGPPERQALVNIRDSIFDFKD